MAFRGLIDGAGRLVQNEDFRLLHKSPGQTESLTLTARKIAPTFGYGVIQTSRQTPNERG